MRQGPCHRGELPAHRDVVKEISTGLHAPLSSNCFPKLNLPALRRPGSPPVGPRRPWQVGSMERGPAGRTGGGLHAGPSRFIISNIRWSCKK